MSTAGVREYLLDEPHFVYRCYGVSGVLLYVGCTTNLKSRLRQHKGSSSTMRSPWYDLTVRITTEDFPNAASARTAEDEAIRVEFPVFNVMGTGKHSPTVTGFTIEPHRPVYVPRHALAGAA